MGRKPSKPNAIPRFRVRARGAVRYYFYDHGKVGDKRVEEPLGKDYGLAIQRWAEIEREAAVPPQAAITFRGVADRYRAEVIPTKAPRTQRDNLKELAKLLEFFDDPPGPLDAIEPHHVGQYLHWRRDAPVRALREKALLSHLWNWAREAGYTRLPNPCAGIRGKPGKGRDVYIEDSEYEAIWEAASPTLRDAMDLAYLTGQRPADVLHMDETHVRDEVIRIRQGKTGAKVRVELADSLAAVLARIQSRKAALGSLSTRLVVNESGRSIGVNALSRHWAAACKAAGVEGVQFRDLRAKAATDKEESGGMQAAQRLLGHSRSAMTEHYVKNRRGAKVTPPELRKSPKDAEKRNAPEGASNMEAEVGIEPAYADLQSGQESSNGGPLH